MVYNPIIKDSKDAASKKVSTKGRPDTATIKNVAEASSSRVSRKSLSRAEVSKSPSRLDKSTVESSINDPRQKSPGRKKSPVRRSPARKSPARKSPARRSPVRKSPVRKSPARKSPTQKSPAQRSSPARSSTTRSPGRKLVSEGLTAGRKPISESSTAVSSKLQVLRQRKLPVVEVESDSDNTDLSHHEEKPKAAVRGRARRLEEDRYSPKIKLQAIKRSVEKELDNYISAVRQPSVQKSQPPEIERIIHLQHEPSLKKLSEFSDEDDFPISHKLTPHVESKFIADSQEVGLGGTVGALLLIFTTPLITLMLYVSCNETHCSFTELPSFQRYEYLSSFFDKNAFLVYTGYTTLIAVLSAIPFGGRKVSGMPNKQGKLSYIMNGVFVTAVSFLTLFALEFFDVPVISIILHKYFQLIISGLAIACFVSLYLYVHSYFVPVSALNPRAVTNSHLHNFFVGRELNPRILKNLDIKVVLLRFLLLSAMLLNSIFIFSSLEFTQSSEEASGFDIKLLKMNPSLLVIGALQIIYCMDVLIFENTIVTSSSIQHEGAGYFMSVTGFTGMFSIVSATKYIYDYKITLPAWQLMMSVLLFCSGYFLFRRSNLQKHAFRINPYSPSVSHLETLPTAQGKKLIVSSFWGFVRHPNYLGDIIIQVSFSLFVLTKPPIIVYICTILYLVYKAHQDGVRCKHLYGAAWDRYCQRVKYVLIPKVY